MLSELKWKKLWHSAIINNDIEMLKGVGIGVAMGNAQIEVKHAADFVTQSNEEDGIYEGLKHFGLIY